MFISLKVAVSEGSLRPVRLVQEITLAAIMVMSTHTITTSSTFMLTLSGMPPRGPPALLEVAVIMLNLTNVKNMSVVFERTLGMLHMDGATLAVNRYSGRATMLAMVEEFLMAEVGRSGGTNGAKPEVPMQKKLMTIIKNMTVTPSMATVLLMWVLTPALNMSSAAKNVMTTTGVTLTRKELNARPAPVP